MPIRKPRRAGLLGATMQLTTYARGDDGARRKGLIQCFDPLILGQYALTKNIEVAHYANNGISFTAPNTVADAGTGLVTILTGDVVVIKGAANAANNGAFTVAGGGVAGSFTTVENTIVNELAGAYVKLYKRAAHSNNAVRDLRTGLMWSRYTSNGEKVGETSNGLLIWADATKVFPLHPAAADLQMVVPGNILRIVGGAAELPRYHAGDLLDPSGFASADNNLPCAYVLSVAVNGADLDITLDPWGLPAFVAEAAGGARTIGLVCRSIFNYAAGANLIGLSGYTDWRNPDREELDSLGTNEALTGVPNAVAFPGWPAADLWTSTSAADAITTAIISHFLVYCGERMFKTSAYLAALVRG